MSSLDTWADDALLGAMADGDQAALVEVYRRYGDRLYGLALSVLGDEVDASTVVRSVLLDLWASPAPERAQGGLCPHLVRGAHRRAIAVLRARPQPAGMPHGGSSSSAGELTETPVPGVDRLLQPLSDGQRRVIRMAYFEGCTSSEIDAAVGGPDGSAASAIRAALGALSAVSSGADGSRGSGHRRA